MIQYGKIIGVAKKSGIQVFERFEGCKRIITSVKNSKVLKIIERENYEEEKILQNMKDKIKTFGHNTDIYDADRNLIRHINRDTRKSTNGLFKDFFFTKKGSLSFSQSISLKNKKLNYISRILKNGELNFEILKTKNDEKTVPWVRIFVQEPIITENGVRVNPGVYASNMQSKTEKLAYCPSDIKYNPISREGAQSLYDEFKKFFMSKYFNYEN